MNIFLSGQVDSGVEAWIGWGVLVSDRNLWGEIEIISLRRLGCS